MSLIFEIEQYILNVLKNVAGNHVDTQKVVIEPIKDSTHGDLATNAAMVCAKSCGMQPRVLAEKLLTVLEASPYIAQASIAGPGFININLKLNSLWQEVQNIFKTPHRYGDLTMGKHQRINIEYVSTNPTGPLHIGHGRNAILGDMIARLLQKAGYDVVKEYYINDAGGQTIALAKSAYLRYKQALGHPIHDDDFDADMYRGDYLIVVGNLLAEKFGDKFLTLSEMEYLEPIRIFTINAMMEKIREDLALLGVQMDVYTSEAVLTEEGWVNKALEKLELSGDVYQGVLEKPKGHHVEDWEERPQTLFCSTAYGDDIDRALKKSDGSWTYFAGDVGYHYQKISRGFDKIIDILGFDHIGYVKRITSVVKALKAGQDFAIKTCQMVNFLENGKPLRMSKRAGNFITINQLIERVGKDATRFMMISRHQDMPIDFDFQKVLDQSKDNPLFYIQYAYARIHSVLRHAKNLFGVIPETNDLTSLTDESEISLIKALIQLPRVVTASVVHLEPHRIANYLYDTSSLFHSLWNKGKENTHLRFIDENNLPHTAARIMLLKATASILSEGLEILGIQPLEEMR